MFATLTRHSSLATLHFLVPDAVNVRSVCALAELRAALAKFAAAVSQSLDEVDMELRRAVDWVRLDRPGHWKKELQRSWDRVAEARNELAQCEARAYDGQRPSCYQEKKGPGSRQGLRADLPGKDRHRPPLGRGDRPGSFRVSRLRRPTANDAR